MLATIDAQHEAFDARVCYLNRAAEVHPVLSQPNQPNQWTRWTERGQCHARAFWPTLVCVMAHYPLTTRTTTGPFLVRPVRLADTDAGLRASAMRREVLSFDGGVNATDTAAAVADHLVARAAMMRIDATHATYLANAGILEIWSHVRATSFSLSWWFETVEAQRARVARSLYRSWPSSWLEDCHFHPEVGAVDFAETVLLARRLCEELSLAVMPARPARHARHERHVIIEHVIFEPVIFEPVGPERPVRPVDLECAVCMDTATDPVRVPCSHVFCEQCITAWFDVSTQQTCPVCRCVFA